MLKSYRKKPVVIQAIQYTGDPAPIWEAYPDHSIGVSAGNLIIPTLEGMHTAIPSDYIIQGVNGEIYPCKEEIFWKTYEEVE